MAPAESMRMDSHDWIGMSKIDGRGWIKDDRMALIKRVTWPRGWPRWIHVNCQDRIEDGSDGWAQGRWTQRLPKWDGGGHATRWSLAASIRHGGGPR
ncbi:hypothetical protein E2562_029249 [Oryza meyeriana var. granulata]|uniref:Uncharacterized protein n=1 Tax=Oryza meyeriana var. granulata TaxID=110450 RepID=A0A6G1EQW1_9ORYZ|nr:hypothetical protein E2562_029249 [Oryza meyeriana var. granulata]